MALGEVIPTLAVQKERRIMEGHPLRDHFHLLIAIPLKYAVSQVSGFIKGLSLGMQRRGWLHTSTLAK